MFMGFASVHFLVEIRTSLLKGFVVEGGRRKSNESEWSFSWVVTGVAYC